MNLFPKAAWPGLSFYAPDKLISMESRFDRARPGSPEQRAIREEAQSFIKEFKAFATSLLATEIQSDLERLVQWQKTNRDFQDRYFSKPCRELLEADLTMTELGRLLRLHKQYAPPTRSLAEALDALERSGKFRS